MSKEHRLPDYKLSIYRREPKKANPQAGAAWVNPDGSISLSINLGVTLNGSSDLSYTLFPYDKERAANPDHFTVGGDKKDKRKTSSPPKQATSSNQADPDKPPF